MSIQKQSSHPDRLVLDFEDNRLLTTVFGEHDRNLARIEQRLGIVIINRGNRAAIEGLVDRRLMAKRVLVDLYDMAKRGQQIDLGTVDGAIRMAEAGLSSQSTLPPTRAVKVNRKGAPNEGTTISTRNRVITPRSPAQSDYISKLMSSEMIFGIGPAGTGKTYLAVAVAVSKMLSGEVERIVLSRPAVEAGENLGFLPGDLREKVDPYLRPLYDALYDMLPADHVEKYITSNQIEIAPLAYMRGRTLSNAFIILDEAQNTTTMQMKMFLTRFGENSRMVISGDPSQVDLPDGSPSGLAHSMHILNGVKGIEVTRFTAKDVVRHPLVGRIVDAYDSQDNLVVKKISRRPIAATKLMTVEKKSKGDEDISYDE